MESPDHHRANAPRLGAGGVVVRSGEDAAGGPFGTWAYRRLDALVGRLQQVDRQLAELQARRIDLLAQADDWAAEAAGTAEARRELDATDGQRREMADHTVALELSCALRISRTSMPAQITEAVRIRRLSVTFAALRGGEISKQHATIIADGCDEMPAEAVPAFEAELAGIAARTTTAILRRRARALREARHPESITERNRSARAERRVVLEPAADGMGWLHAYGPITDCVRVYEALTEAGVTVRRGTYNRTADPRTVAQLRVDLLFDFVLGRGRLRAGSVPGLRRRELDVIAEQSRRSARPRLLATVPVLTMLGKSDEPAVLHGYGPIDPVTAAELAADAPSFTRLLTHPVDGTVLDLDRTTHRVPADLQRWLQVRDGTCRAPFSTTSATRCDIDHTNGWYDDDGATNHDNLAHLSRRWHRAKHVLGWKASQNASGTLVWTSPTGRYYKTEPETPMRRRPKAVSRPRDGAPPDGEDAPPF